MARGFEQQLLRNESVIEGSRKELQKVIRTFKFDYWILLKMEHPNILPDTIPHHKLPHTKKGVSRLSSR